MALGAAVGLTLRAGRGDGDGVESDPLPPHHE
jgi:hypothetical protein